MYGEVIEDGNGGLTYRTLAGAASDGLPVGTIVAVYTNQVPGGFLPCNGTEFDINQYSALYLLLGSNTTPDLREATLVGVGLSTRAVISNHDVYTIGQFKDDQIQTLQAGAVTNETIDSETAQGVVYSPVRSDGSINYYTYRNGTVTHGKQVGVNYVIKATVGSVAISDPDIYNDIVGYIDQHFVMANKDELPNGCLVKYDEENGKFVPVELPTISDSVLSAEVQYTEDWKFNDVLYDKDLNEVVNEEDPSSSTEIGRMTADYITYTTTFNGNVYEINNTFYDKKLNEITPSDYYEIENKVLSQKVVLNDDIYYTKKEGYWYPVNAIDYDVLTTGPVVVDSTLIDTLNNETELEITLRSIIIREFKEVTGFTPTGFITNDTITHYDIPSSEYLPVYYNIYYGTDFEYKWKSNGNGKGIAFVGTREEYEVAKLISEGQEGFIPNNSIVIITDETYKLRGEE